MSYQRYCLLAVALASLVSAQEAPTTTAPPPHLHPHHGVNHQHHGHHKLEHHSLQREDQEQAFKKLSGLISDSIAPEPSNTTTTTSSTTSSSTSGDGSSSDATTEASGSSTTARPYRATASQLVGVLRRNIAGLRNLIQKEWSVAMEDSRKNSAAAKAEFSKSVRPFLQKNGTASG